MQAYQLTLATIDQDFKPASDYIYVERFTKEHMLYREYHYADCDCAECYKAHYPCNDPDCDYCDSVKSLMFDLIRDPNDKSYERSPNIFTIRTGKIIDRSDGNIIDYATYLEILEIGNYELEDMLWSQCEQCNKLIHGLERNTYEYDDHYFCSESCQGTFKDDEKNLCKFCSENPVSEDHKYLCNDCLENAEHGYPIEAYEMEYYDECWIGPDGTVYSVNDEYGGHESAAIIMGYEDEAECEKAGFIHVSDCYGDPWIYIPRNLTQEQVYSITEVCEVKGWDIPNEVQEYIDRQEQTMEIKEYNFDDYMEHVKMQNLAVAWLKMPRSQRDQFYKLSGD